jgi:hypothetical protein
LGDKAAGITPLEWFFDLTSGAEELALTNYSTTILDKKNLPHPANYSFTLHALFEE